MREKMDLYKLLPELYRLRDAEEGYPLQALLDIISEQAEVVRQNIDALWDDLFIETCAEWVIPYIGDLVGNAPLHDVAQPLRADVAKTIYYRRRKGTLPMLEELACDVTGWAAHAVAFFEVLGWTQHLEHRRSTAVWTDIRSPERAGRIDGPFDDASHTADVRHPAQDEGWHNIHNIGFFLWRLGSYPLQDVPARQAGQPWRYHFSPLGNKAALFSRMRRERDETGMTTELHVAGPIRPALFYRDLEDHRNRAVPRPDHTDLYGLFAKIKGNPLNACPACSLTIFHNGSPVAPAADTQAPLDQYQSQIVCGRLDPWPAQPPTGRVIVVDVETGRLAVGDGWPVTTAVDVCFHYGFSADMGSGTYDRRRWLAIPDGNIKEYWVKEKETPAGAYASLTGVPGNPGALDDWTAAGRPNAVITILDSRTYPLPATITLRNEGWLFIQAANGERPLLQPAGPQAELELDVLAPAVPGDPERSAALTLSGVVVEGCVKIIGGLGRLHLLHSTLIPGRRLQEDGEPETQNVSLQVTGALAGAPINARLRIECDFSITGPLRVPELTAGIWLRDSILDGFDEMALSGPPGDPGPNLVIERTTVFGKIDVKSLEASEAVFTGQVHALRRQEGCMRFSYAPPESITPRRYRCQPDLAVEQAIQEALRDTPGLSPADQGLIAAAAKARVTPSFATQRYGQPAYAQLAGACPREITSGAEDGAEMGAFKHLMQPQRETNLRIRLQEYLPFGLEPGIIFIT